VAKAPVTAVVQPVISTSVNDRAAGQARAQDRGTARLEIDSWQRVMWAGAMIGTMGPVAGADAVADGAAGRGAGGVVSRPRLFGRLAAQARVSVVSAPAGSGKTVLLRSWIRWRGVAGRAAWVPAGRGERDPQRFWLLVLAALRQTAAGSALVRELTAAPDLDGWVIIERLLADLAPLDDPLWLVVDDVQELGSDALRQLELLIMRAPAGLRFVLATRHDVQLGLHRLRLEGELAEIREPDLRLPRRQRRRRANHLDRAGQPCQIPPAAGRRARPGAPPGVDRRRDGRAQTQGPCAAGTGIFRFAAGQRAWYRHFPQQRSVNLS